MADSQQSGQADHAQQLVQREYIEVASLIRLAADSVHARVEAAATEPARRGRGWRLWFKPDPHQQAQAWQALADRLLPPDKTPPAAKVDAGEVQALQQEYQNLRAWEAGMAAKVFAYQVVWLAGLNAIAVGLYVILPSMSPEGWAERFVRDDLVHRYLACAYWGAAGACASSLWELATHTLARRLTPDASTLHYAKPLVGAILGPMMIQLLDLKFLATAGGVDPGAAVTAYGVATLAGMNQRLIIQKIKDLAATLFGHNQNQK